MTRRRSAEQVVVEPSGTAKARPKLRLCGDPAESDVQRQVLKTLAAMPEVALVCRINSGAFTREDAAGKEQFYPFCTIYSALMWDFLPKHFDYAGLKRAKLRMPDVVGMLKGSGRLFVFEVKKRGKKAMPGQAAFLDLVCSHGGIAGVVQSAQEAVDALVKCEKTNEQTAV